MTSLTLQSLPRHAGTAPHTFLDSVLANRVVRAVVWCRYLAMAALCLWLAYRANIAAEARLTDWVVFENAARTIVHYHHIPIYNSPALHLYADNPSVQIGPPAVLSVAAVQWAKPTTVQNFFIAVMGCCGVLALASFEAAARRLLPDFSRRRLAALMTVVGLPTIAVWGNWVGFWLHWDDVIAVTGVAVAVWVIARRGSWLIVGLLLGTAVASKPWAIVMTPVLLGLPRRDRSRGVLAFLGVAALWWGPFVLAAPHTIQSLGSLAVPMKAGSVLRLFGLRANTANWLRPVQFIAGGGFATWIALRSERAWLAAPLAGLAVRVFLDPYLYAYYGLGPVLFAFLWDFTRSTKRRLPYFTVCTIMVEFVLLWFVNEDREPNTPVEHGRMIAISVSKLVWCLGVMAVLTWQTGRARREEQAAAHLAQLRSEPGDASGEIRGEMGAECPDVLTQDREPARPSIATA